VTNYPQLSRQQNLFVGYYIETDNATEAARRAGYAHLHAHKQAPRLLKKPQIAEAIKFERERLRAVHRVTADRVIEEIAKMAFAEVDPKTGIKGSDKVQALSLLARRFGLLVDKTEITGKDGAPIATITADATPEQAAEAYKNLLQ